MENKKVGIGSKVATEISGKIVTATVTSIRNKRAGKQRFYLAELGLWLHETRVSLVEEQS